MGRGRKDFFLISDKINKKQEVQKKKIQKKLKPVEMLVFDINMFCQQMLSGKKGDSLTGVCVCVERERERARPMWQNALRELSISKHQHILLNSFSAFLLSHSLSFLPSPIIFSGFVIVPY